MAKPLSITLVALVLGTNATTGRADSIDVASLPDLENRDYSIDLFQGAALGSVRIIGMGGAAVATAEGSAGTSANPASPAMRPATSRGDWAWDWHLDWLKPDLGSDFDNNGIKTEKDGLVPLVTLGLVVQYKKWGFAFGGTRVSNTTSVTDESISTNAQIARLTVARSIPGDFTVGAGLRFGSLSVETSESKLFEIAGAGIELGTVWHPAAINLRLGVTAALPVAGKDVNNDNCDPLDCFGYILPEEVSVPWRLSAGAAWRFSDSKWNKSVDKEFIDERALTVAADVVVSGSVGDGHGVEAFAQRKLQRSGRRASASVRTGAEYELVPGRLRLRAGSYWEPSRVANVSGRLHGTTGAEVRVYAFRLWDSTYRLRISLTGDFANGYVNTGISIGFWH